MCVRFRDNVPYTHTQWIRETQQHLQTCTKISQELPRQARQGKLGALKTYVDQMWDSKQKTLRRKACASESWCVYHTCLNCSRVQKINMKRLEYFQSFHNNLCLMLNIQYASPSDTTGFKSWQSTLPCLGSYLNPDYIGARLGPKMDAQRMCNQL